MAPFVLCYNPPQVPDKSPGAPASVKLVYSLEGMASNFPHDILFTIITIAWKQSLTGIVNSKTN